MTKIKPCSVMLAAAEARAAQRKKTRARGRGVKRAAAAARLKQEAQGGVKQEAQGGASRNAFGAKRGKRRVTFFTGGYREYTQEDVSEAIELVHSGMPVIDAALKYGIPRATLFNRSRDGCKTHSGRCSEVFSRTHEGSSSFKKRTKLLQYTRDMVEKAIEAVHGGMPVIDASILYQIPRASLFMRSARGCPSHRGRCSTVYSDGKPRRSKTLRYKYKSLVVSSAKATSDETPAEGAEESSQSKAGPEVPIIDATTGKEIVVGERREAESQEGGGERREAESQEGGGERREAESQEGGSAGDTEAGATTSAAVLDSGQLAPTALSFCDEQANPVIVKIEQNSDTDSATTLEEN